MDEGQTRCIAVVAAVVEVALVVSVGAFAHGGSPVLTAPLAVSAPVVDGNIRPADEWADAAKLPIPFTGHPATLYVKHDETQLYFLLTVTDDPPAGGIRCCSLSIYFDNNHNGVREIGEDEMGFGPTDQSSDQFFGSIPNLGPPQYFDDRLDGGTDNTATAGSYDASGGRLILEARKPLCSGDSAHDFCLATGSTAGFTLDYFTSAGNATLDYPAVPDDFARFGDLRISPTRLADLEVRTDANKKSVGVGESVTYTMTVTNHGPGNATDVVLNTAYERSGVTARVPPETCGCELGTLGPGEDVTIKKTVTPTSVVESGGTIADRATVSAVAADPEKANNTDEFAVKVTSAPAVGKAVTAEPSGAVRVRTPGTKSFVRLRRDASIATGSELDASKGRVRVASATPGGKLQRATASAGRFQLTQTRAKALTVLRLSAPLKCRPGAATTVLRRLRVETGGNFRTAGARGWAMPEKGSATWSTVDLCAPAGRRLSAVDAKKPKRTKRTCYTNLSKRSEICVYDPENRREVMVRPKKKKCL